jgi:hypothetical protein
VANRLLSRDEGDAQLFVDHQGKDTHLCGAALVQFNGTLLQLGFGIEGVPAEINESVAEVTHEFSSGDVLHDSQFQEANEGNDLGNTSGGDGGQGTETTWDIGKGLSGEVDQTGKADSGFGGQVTNDGKHADAAVLDFDVTKAVELFLVTVGHQSQRIEESKGRLGTEFVLEGHAQGGGRRLLGDRGKGGGAGKKGGKDGEFHDVS